MSQSKTPYYYVPEPDYPELVETSPAGRTEEAALIAAVMRKPEKYGEACDIVTAESFGWKAYGEAWAAIVELAKNVQAIDQITVGDELERRGQLGIFLLHDNAQWSGRIALSVLRDQGQPQHVRTYADTVQDYAAKRELTNIARTLATWSMNGRRAEAILGDTEKLLSSVKVGSGKAAKHTAGIEEAVRMASLRTEAAHRGEISYIPTGFRKLDDIVVGFTAPDLWIMAARPKMGKTAFLASIAMNAVNMGKRVVFFTLEMGMTQIAMRFISMISGVSYTTQLTGKLTDNEWAAYYEAIEKIGSGNIGLYLNDLPSINPNKVRQELRRIGKVDLVIFDYIQIGSADQKYEIRNQEVAAITKGLKELCKELDVPMLAAAQLNRAAEARSISDKKPILSDLGESDELGKTADKVLFIHGDIGSSTREISVAANRNGPCGICTLDFVGHKTLFQNQKGVTQS